MPTRIREGISLDLNTYKNNTIVHINIYYHLSFSASRTELKVFLLTFIKVYHI